jgi:hypothetical protein
MAVNGNVMGGVGKDQVGMFPGHEQGKFSTLRESSQSSLWWPSSHRSPGRVTAASGGGIGGSRSLAAATLLNSGSSGLGSDPPVGVFLGHVGSERALHRSGLPLIFRSGIPTR